VTRLSRIHPLTAGLPALVPDNKLSNDEAAGAMARLIAG
jgi:hypothetical protein